jgi:hypothetical protein
MASRLKSGVDAKVCLDKDLSALSADNHSLREQAVSLLLEIEMMRENLEASTVGFQMLRYKTGGMGR